MWGSTTGRRFDGPISDLIEMVDGTPVDVHGSFRAHATSVERTGGDRVRRGSGNVSFVDPFAPARIDGTVEDRQRRRPSTPAGSRPRRSDGRASTTRIWARRAAASRRGVALVFYIAMGCVNPAQR
jgi:hypothetical protein